MSVIVNFSDAPWLWIVIIAAVVIELSVEIKRKHTRLDRIHRVLRGHTGKPSGPSSREIQEVKCLILGPNILLYKSANSINCEGIIIKNNFIKGGFVSTICTNTENEI